jgi:membrane protein required for colicin V production
MTLTPVDWTIAAIAGVSIGLGLWRGFMREVLSLAGWITGLWLALLHAAPLGERFPVDLPWPAARTALAALLIVIGCLVVAALVAMAVKRLLRAVSLSGTDRLLGAMFGAARAALLLLVLAYLAGRTSMVQQPAWKQSVLLPHVEAAVRFVSPWIAPHLAPARGD